MTLLLMAVHFCALASGSAGNATFLATGSTRILIDDGLSLKELKARLNSIGEDIERLDAILVTHEHSDHVGGLPVLAKSKKLRAPIYMTEATSKAVTWGTEPRIEIFRPGAVFRIGDIAVMPFSVPHDAVDPVGYRFEVDGKRIGFVTDVGRLSDPVKEGLRDVDLLMLESNFDPDMLKYSPYPWEVRRRVLGNHLSNAAALAWLQELKDWPRHLVMAHLSEVNNHEALVRLQIENLTKQIGVSPLIEIATQHTPGSVHEL